MGCPVCSNLDRAFAAGLRDYLEARSSACYEVSVRPAARKLVEMERARYELEEHRLGCAWVAPTALRVPAPLPAKKAPTSLRQIAA